MADGKIAKYFRRAQLIALFQSIVYLFHINKRASDIFTGCSSFSSVYVSPPEI